MKPQLINTLFTSRTRAIIFGQLKLKKHL